MRSVVVVVLIVALAALLGSAGWHVSNCRLRGELEFGVSRSSSVGDSLKGVAAMKLVIAYVQSEMLDAVRRALSAAEIFTVTVNTPLGLEQLPGHNEAYQGVGMDSRLQRKTRIEVAVNDSCVDPAIRAIIKGAQIDKTGDAKILVMPPAQSVPT